MTTIATVIALVVLVALIANRKAVATVWFNFRSLIGLGARKLDAKNAVANMKQAVEDTKRELQSRQRTLAKSQAQIDSLTRNATESQTEAARYKKRIQDRHAEVPNEPNDAILLDLASKFAAAQKRSAELESELSTQKSLHENVIAQIKEAVTRADRLEKDAASMGVKLDLATQRAELAEACNSFSCTASSSLSAAEEYRKKIQDSIDEQNAAVTVACQLQPQHNAESKKWEADQDAKAVLASMGIQ